MAGLLRCSTPLHVSQLHCLQLWSCHYGDAVPKCRRCIGWQIGNARLSTLCCNTSMIRLVC